MITAMSFLSMYTIPNVEFGSVGEATISYIILNINLFSCLFGC